METDSAAFTVEEGPVRGLGLRERIAGDLASMIRALAMVAMIHYMCLSLGSYLHNQIVSNTTPDTSGVITGGRVGRLSRPVQSRGHGTTGATDL